MTTGEVPVSRPRLTIEGYAPDPIQEEMCNCVCLMHHLDLCGVKCAGAAQEREVEVTWIDIMTGEPGESRVEPVCRPCYDAVVTVLSRPQF